MGFTQGSGGAPEFRHPDWSTHRGSVHRHRRAGALGCLRYFIPPQAWRNFNAGRSSSFHGVDTRGITSCARGGELPVGSIIVRDGEVIGRGQNRVNSHADPTCHGETDAIRNACRALGSPDLTGSTLYTAMEPCPMCCWSIVLANIETLVLGARHAEMGRTDYGDYSVEKLLDMGNRTVNLVTGVRVAECEALRRSWSGWVEPKP